MEKYISSKDELTWELLKLLGNVFLVSLAVFTLQPFIYVLDIEGKRNFQWQINSYAERMEERKNWLLQEAERLTGEKFL